MLNNVNEEILKAASFNEKDSRKANALKSVFGSKLFLGLIIAYISIAVISIIASIVSGISLGFESAVDVIDILFQAGLQAIIPFFFARLLIREYFASNDKTIKGKNISPLETIFSIRKFAKVYLVFFGICLLFYGLALINYGNIIEAYNQTVSDENFMIKITEEELLLYKNIGYNSIFTSIFYLLMNYSLILTSKLSFRNVIMDKEVDSSVKINFYISMSIIGIFGLLNLIGIILWGAGITNFLFPEIIEFENPLVYLSLLQVLATVVYIVLGIIILYKSLNALQNNNGSSNPLYGDTVYTINIDDLEEHKEN